MQLFMPYAGRTGNETIIRTRENIINRRTLHKFDSPAHTNDERVSKDSFRDRGQLNLK